MKGKKQSNKRVPISVYHHLQNIYFDPKHPAGFSSASKLFRFVKEKYTNVTLRDVKIWLAGQDAYTLHKPLRHRFKRRKTLSKGIDYQWQADLAFLINLKRYNKGYQYLLTVIDVFSRFAFALPLKSKTRNEIINAFQLLFKTRKPKYLQTDDGTEFHNKDFKAFLKKHDVKLFSTKSDTKGSIVERWNRTLKDKMFKYFTKHNTLNYIDVLQDLVHAYNNSIHRSIGMTPAAVNPNNESILWEKQYKKHIQQRKSPQYKFKIGDKVRLSKLRRIFKKGYLPKWTDEYFAVIDQIATNPPVYKIIDLNGEILDGAFYKQELQKIEISENEEYKIDILKRRVRKGKKQYFVHYRGWPDSFDEWINASQLSNL